VENLKTVPGLAVFGDQPDFLRLGLGVRFFFGSGHFACRGSQRRQRLPNVLSTQYSVQSTVSLSPTPPLSPALSICPWPAATWLLHSRPSPTSTHLPGERG